ncbi:MAG: MopE-related protein, partial [Nanoarchaeota archaeon]
PSLPVFSLSDSIAPNGAEFSCINSVTYETSTGRYLLTCSSQGQTVTQYEININSPEVLDGLLTVKEIQTNSYPVRYAGTIYRKLDGTITSPFGLSQIASTTMTHSLANNKITLHYTEFVEGATLEKEFIFSIYGKSLVVQVRAINPSTSSTRNYAGISFGRSEQTPNPEKIVVPYAEGMPMTEAGPVNARYFFSAYPDYTLSGSNSGPLLLYSIYSQTSIVNYYSINYVAGQNYYPPLDDTAYITVSLNVEDLFPKIRNSPSPFLNGLRNRVVFDFWRTGSWANILQGNTYFEKSIDLFSRLKSYGLENMAIIYHQWQKYGYDCGFPTLSPASSLAPPWNPTISYGGTPAMQALVNYVKSNGFLFALHENYRDHYDNNDYWQLPTSSPFYPFANLAKDDSGNVINAWYNSYCTAAPQSKVLASDKMTLYAQDQSSQIDALYDPNADYLDVTTALELDFMLDYSETNTNARTLRQALDNAINLDIQQRNVYDNVPVFGEGLKRPLSSQKFQAGFVDGIEGEVTNGENSPLIVNYELGNIRNIMVNQGMGFLSRWWFNVPATCTPQYQNIIMPGTCPWESYPIDKYRASALAFGRVGWLDSASIGDYSFAFFVRYWVWEYYLFQAIQKQFDTAQTILYKNPSGVMVDLTQAIKDNTDFMNAQLKITYASGLILYVNYHQTQTWTVNEGGVNYYLPPNGWLGVNPSQNFLQYSALVDLNNNPGAAGARADFVRSGDYVMVNGRGVLINFGTHFGQQVSTDKIKVVRPNGWSLTEQSDGSFLLVNAVVCVDADFDGYSLQGGGNCCGVGGTQTCGIIADCNDNNAAINPGAIEICNDLIDNNCNNLIDCSDGACFTSLYCAVPAVPSGLGAGLG